MIIISYLIIKEQGRGDFNSYRWKHHVIHCCVCVFLTVCQHTHTHTHTRDCGEENAAAKDEIKEKK